MNYITAALCWVQLDTTHAHNVSCWFLALDIPLAGEQLCSFTYVAAGLTAPLAAGVMVTEVSRPQQQQQQQQRQQQTHAGWSRTRVIHLHPASGAIHHGCQYAAVTCWHH
jgi:hypothetical protein